MYWIAVYLLFTFINKQLFSGTYPFQFWRAWVFLVFLGLIARSLLCKETQVFGRHSRAIFILWVQLENDLKNNLLNLDGVWMTLNLPFPYNSA